MSNGSALPLCRTSTKLAVVSACKIQAFRNVELYIGEIARFFAFSAKQQRLFDRPSKGKKLNSWRMPVEQGGFRLSQVATSTSRHFSSYGCSKKSSMITRAGNSDTVTKANCFPISSTVSLILDLLQDIARNLAKSEKPHTYASDASHWGCISL